MGKKKNLNMLTEQQLTALPTPRLKNVFNSARAVQGALIKATTEHLDGHAVLEAADYEVHQEKYKHVTNYVSQIREMLNSRENA